MSASPRVMQVVLALNAGGTERLVVELVRRLRHEMPMAVCCLDEQGVWGEALAREGVEVRALRRRGGFDWRVGRDVAALAARQRANVLHCHHYSPFVYGSLARLWYRNCRVVFTEHGRLSDAPPSRKRRLANLLFARLPDRVFTVSEDLRRHLTTEGFHPSAVEVIYNGVDLGSCPEPRARSDVRRRLGVDPEVLVVGTIARLDPVKDLNTLIQAVADARRRIRVELLVVGDGPERGNLQKTAAERDMGRQVHFLGHRDDARTWLAGCDVYANSSLSEGVSLTLLEAMAAGLPIVATRVGGTPEVVDDACGLLVPARDPAALSEAVVQLASDPPRRAALGRAARRRVETRFTLDRMVQQYSSVYRSSVS